MKFHPLLKQLFALVISVSLASQAVQGAIDNRFPAPPSVASRPRICSEAVVARLRSAIFSTGRGEVVASYRAYATGTSTFSKGQQLAFAGYGTDYGGSRLFDREWIEEWFYRRIGFAVALDFWLRLSPLSTADISVGLPLAVLLAIPTTALLFAPSHIGNDWKAGLLNRFIAGLYMQVLTVIPPILPGWSARRALALHRLNNQLYLAHGSNDLLDDASRAFHEGLPSWEKRLATGRYAWSVFPQRPTEDDLRTIAQVISAAHKAGQNIQRALKDWNQSQGKGYLWFYYLWEDALNDLIMDAQANDPPVRAKSLNDPDRLERINPDLAAKARVMKALEDFKEAGDLELVGKIPSPLTLQALTQQIETASQRGELMEKAAQRVVQEQTEFGGFNWVFLLRRAFSAQFRAGLITIGESPRLDHLAVLHLIGALETAINRLYISRAPDAEILQRLQVIADTLGQNPGGPVAESLSKPFVSAVRRGIAHRLHGTIWKVGVVHLITNQIGASPLLSVELLTRRKHAPDVEITIDDRLELPDGTTWSLASMAKVDGVPIRWAVFQLDSGRGPSAAFVRSTPPISSLRTPSGHGTIQTASVRGPRGTQDMRRKDTDKKPPTSSDEKPAASPAADPMANFLAGLTSVAKGTPTQGMAEPVVYVAGKETGLEDVLKTLVQTSHLGEGIFKRKESTKEEPVFEYTYREVIDAIMSLREKVEQLRGSQVSEEKIQHINNVFQVISIWVRAPNRLVLGDLGQTFKGYEKELRTLIVDVLNAAAPPDDLLRVPQKRRESLEAIDKVLWSLRMLPQLNGRPETTVMLQTARDRRHLDWGIMTLYAYVIAFNRNIRIENLIWRDNFRTTKESTLIEVNPALVQAISWVISPQSMKNNGRLKKLVAKINSMAPPYSRLQDPGMSPVNLSAQYEAYRNRSVIHAAEMMRSWMEAIGESAPRVNRESTRFFSTASGVRDQLNDIVGSLLDAFAGLDDALVKASLLYMRSVSEEVFNLIPAKNEPLDHSKVERAQWRLDVLKQLIDSRRGEELLRSFLSTTTGQSHPYADSVAWYASYLVHEPLLDVSDLEWSRGWTVSRGKRLINIEVADAVRAEIARANEANEGHLIARRIGEINTALKGQRGSPRFSLGTSKQSGKGNKNLSIAISLLFAGQLARLFLSWKQTPIASGLQEASFGGFTELLSALNYLWQAHPVIVLVFVGALAFRGWLSNHLPGSQNLTATLRFAQAA